MKVMNLIQGTPEWHAYRATHFNASDAPAMMGASNHVSRSKLLHRLATGETAEVGPQLQALFDRGHAAEAAVRPIIEATILDDLHPVTGECDAHPKLSASFDGMTLCRTTAIEVKLWNEALAQQVAAGEITDPHYYWQLEQHFVVNEALERLIFVVTKDDAAEYLTLEYTPVAGRREALIAGWAQFEADLAAYVPAAAVPKVVATPVETLPAIVYTINRGDMTVAHNLADYRAATEILAERAKLPLVNDQDFADRAAMAKCFRDAEAMLKAKADEAIGQIADIAAFSRGLKDLAEIHRKLAIDAENLVEAEKKNRKDAILAAGKKAMTEHMVALDARFAGRVVVPAPALDLAGAAKNKRTLESVTDAVDTAVAQAKIAANAAAELIAGNLAALDELAPDHGFLFRDLQQLVTMPAEAFRATVEGRVATHKAQEEARLQAERERIAREEREKAEREARAKVEAEERARREAEEAARITAEVQARQRAAREATPPATPEVPPQAPPAARKIPDSQPAMKAYAELRRPARPTDAEIINLIATTYQVSAAQALEWISQINTTEAKEA